MKTYKVSLFFIGLIGCVSAQTISLKGIVKNENGEELIGANVSTFDALHGTATDLEGSFQLSIPNTYKTFRVSYIGYADDTVYIDTRKKYEIILKEAVLKEVDITYKKLDRSTLNTYNVQTLDAKELTKAACCNLSESFETTAAIDISYSDAVSGAKKTAHAWFRRKIYPNHV